jgi:hypothetical protein
MLAKLEMMQWAGSIVCFGDIRIAYKRFIDKAEVEKALR